MGTKSERPMIMDTVAIDTEGKTITEFRDVINEAVESLGKKYPEYLDNPSFIVLEARETKEDPECLVMYFSRYMTDKEISDEQFRRKLAKESAIESLKRLIDKNFDEAVNYITEKKNKNIS